MGLKAGDIDHMKCSMAKAIEKAFLDEWPEIMNEQGDSQKPEMNDQVRLIFIAVANGVVNHLVENMDAFKVIIDPVPDHTHSYLDTSGTSSVTRTSNPSGGHTHTARINIEVDNNKCE